MVSPVFKNLLLVGLGSCLGGMARYIVSLLCQRSSWWALPCGTLTVNLVGCLFIGLLSGYAERFGGMSVNLRMFLAVGFCGGFTTFSTFMNENVGLIKADASFSMLIYLAGSLVGGFLMVLTGYALMKIL